jgi:prepilin-type N-terminal cleavage/methylation domain-containing protein
MSFKLPNSSSNSHNRGFTLLEMLLVIAIIAILAAIVIVAVNPARQLAQARNAQRASDLNAIYKALQQYYVDNLEYPWDDQDYGISLDSAVYEICETGNDSPSGCAELEEYLVPTYLSALPQNPISGNYVIALDIGEKISIGAPDSGEQDLSPVYIGRNAGIIAEAGGDGNEDPETYECNDGEDNDDDGLTDYDDGNGDPNCDSDTDDSESPSEAEIVAALREGLVGYWPMDEDTLDYSDIGNNGTCSSCPSATTGKVNGAYNFNGSSNYIASTNNSSTITGNSQRTISAWVKLETSDNTKNGDIVTTGSGDCTSKMFSAGSLDYKLHFWSACNDQSSNITIPTNEWVFVAIVYGGSNISATVNQTTVTISKSGFSTAASKLFIGAETTNNGSSFRKYFDGGIDEVSIWNRALSVNEIADLYNDGDGLSLVID